MNKRPSRLELWICGLVYLAAGIFWLLNTIKDSYPEP